MLSSLLLSVLRRGCEGYPSLAKLNRRLDYLYGTDLSLRSFARGDRLITGLALDLLDPAYLPNKEEDLLDQALEVVDQLLFHPLLDEKGLLLASYVEAEKKNLCDRIRARRNHPAAYAVHRCRELLFSEDPSGALYRTTEEDVRAVTPEELTAFYRTLCAHMHLSCFYVGPRAPEELLPLLERRLGAVAKNERPQLPESRTLWLKGEALSVDEELPVTQGHLVLGFSTSVTLRDKLFFACKVFCEMLGGTPTSRLFLEVRERRSLCYSCYSAYDSYKGALLVTCGLANEHRKEAEDAILTQLRKLQEGHFREEELGNAKQSLINIYCQTEDNPSSIENFYFSRASADALLSAEECAARTAAVTREEVLAVARALRLGVTYFLKATLESEEENDDDEAD